MNAYRICRHTKTNGLLCQSPATGTSAFCHFHKRSRRARRSNVGSGPALTEHLLYPLRDARSIQQALSMVVAGLMSNQLPTAKAGKMLFALQTASAHLRNPLKNEEFSLNPIEWSILPIRMSANSNKRID